MSTKASTLQIMLNRHHRHHLIGELGEMHSQEALRGVEEASRLPTSLGGSECLKERLSLLQTVILVHKAWCGLPDYE